MDFSKFLQVLLIVSIGVFHSAFGADSDDPIVGQWKWFTKDTMVVHADGRLTRSAADGSSKAVATWKRLNPGETPCKYEISWVRIKAVDILLLENGENRLSGVGKNIYGDHVSANRMSREDPEKTAAAPATIAPVASAPVASAPVASAPVASPPVASPPDAGAPRLHADLTREQLAAAKSATAFVLTSHGSGTAFCISDSGIFVTCDHVVDNARADSIEVVLSPSGKDEKRYPAKVIRRMKGVDIAILKVSLDRKVPVLKLGAVTDLFETEQLYAFGYPFGKDLAVDAKSPPSISVNVGRLSALRQKDGVLEAIQLDAQVNPGNSGGPVLDPEGNVVGIIQSGVPGSGVNFATPISLLTKEITTPVITIAAPNVDARRQSEPVEFAVAVDWLLPTKEETRVAIEVHTAGQPRKVDAEKGQDGKYRARIALFPPKDKTEKAKLRVTVDFETGKISGTVADFNISISGKPKALREIGSIRRAPGETNFTADGKPAGPLPELAALAIDVGGTVLTVDARKASGIEIQKPSVDTPSISYQAIVTLADGRTLSSDEKTLVISSASGPAPQSPVLAGKVDLPGVREISLPAPISDVVAAQDGRALLLQMKESKKLAVFDVLDLKIRGYINLDEDDALVAAGSRYILVVCPKQSVIERYSVETLQREKTTSNTFGDITSITMGRSSPTIAMMISSGSSPFNSKIMAYDAERMTVVSTADSNISVKMNNPNAFVRASADGRTYGLCRRGVSPTGFTVLTYRDNEFSEFYEHVSLGLLVPNADGTQIFTSQGGLFTNKFVPIIKGNGSWAEGVTYLPSYHPMYFLGVPYDLLPGPEKKKAKTISIYLSGTNQALLQLSEEFKEMQTGRQEAGRMNQDPITMDKRYHFFPQLDVLLTIPPTNDKIVAHPLNIRQILDEKGIDYLYVTSIAPLGKVATPYRFKLEAASKAGGVKFSLQSGPTGLTISSDGAVAWNAPAKPAEETVIVSLKDGSGQEALHTFRIVITE